MIMSCGVFVWRTVILSWEPHIISSKNFRGKILHVLAARVQHELDRNHHHLLELNL